MINILIKNINTNIIISLLSNEEYILYYNIRINNYKKDWVVEKIQIAIKKFLKSTGRQPKVACMGLSYKADIDDLRESPALEIYHELEKAGSHVMAVEPNLRKHAELEITDTLRAVDEADILVFLVAHKEFSSVAIPHGKNVLDFCGVQFKK